MTSINSAYDIGYALGKDRKADGKSSKGRRGEVAFKVRKHKSVTSRPPSPPGVPAASTDGWGKT